MTWAADPKCPLQISRPSVLRRPRTGPATCAEHMPSSYCNPASSPGLCAPCNLLRTSPTRRMVVLILELAERMWLVGEGIIWPKQTYPRTGLLRGDRLSGQAGPHSFIVRRRTCVGKRRDCGVDGDRQSSQQRVVDTPGANGLHGRSAVPIAWRWGPIVVRPPVPPGGVAIMVCVSV